MRKEGFSMLTCCTSYMGGSWDGPGGPNCPTVGSVFELVSSTK